MPIDLRLFLKDAKSTYLLGRSSFLAHLTEEVTGLDGVKLRENLLA